MAGAPCPVVAARVRQGLRRMDAADIGSSELETWKADEVRQPVRVGLWLFLEGRRTR